MEKVLISQQYSCSTIIDGVKVSATTVIIKDGKVEKISGGYFGDSNEHDYSFSVSKNYKGEMNFDGRGPISISPCALAQKFIEQIEKEEAQAATVSNPTDEPGVIED